MGEQPEPWRRREKDECERESGSVPNRTDGTVKLPRCPLTAQDGFSICIKVRSSNMSSVIPSAATMGAARSRSKPILQPRDEVGGGASIVAKRDSGERKRKLPEGCSAATLGSAAGNREQQQQEQQQLPRARLVEIYICRVEKK